MLLKGGLGQGSTEQEAAKDCSREPEERKGGGKEGALERKQGRKQASAGESAEAI